MNILYVADQCQANMFDKFSDILKSVLEWKQQLFNNNYICNIINC